MGIDWFRKNAPAMLDFADPASQVAGIRSRAAVEEASVQGQGFAWTPAILPKHAGYVDPDSPAQQALSEILLTGSKVQVAVAAVPAAIVAAPVVVSVAGSTVVKVGTVAAPIVYGTAHGLQRFGGRLGRDASETYRALQRFVAASERFGGPEPLLEAAAGLAGAPTSRPPSPLVGAGQLAAQMAGRATRLAASRIAEQTASRFRNLQCVECADALVDALKVAGYSGERILLQYRGGPGFIISTARGGSVVSENGRHVGVRIGETVYDNLNPGGIPYQKWLDDLQALGERIITKEGF